MKFIIVLLAVSVLSACSSTEKKAINNEENEGANPNTYGDADLVQDDNTICYQFISFCEGDSGPKSECQIHLAIEDDTVTANTFCSGCKGNVETFYRGIKHEDTLILDIVPNKSDKNEILDRTYWIMSGDQLNQLVTEKHNGKTILKQQATHSFIASYEKMDCE